AAANGLAEDGTDTQAAIDAAQGDRDAASPSVTALPNSAAKTSLMSRLAAVQTTIDDAQDVLDAVNAATVEVGAAEAAANGLTGDGTDTQAAIDAAQSDYNAASTVVDALPNSTAKTLLMSSLATVQAEIDYAQDAVDAVNAATAEVDAAEAAAIGLAGDGTDTQAAIDSAQSTYNVISTTVNALPNSTAKTSLTSRLAAVQATISGAQNNLDIIVGLQEATADATALIEINYTATSWALLQASLALPQSDLSEKANKLAALNQAIDSMVLRVITSITISTWDTFPLVMTSPGAYLHSPFLAKVLDQFGIEMTTESVIWSMSGNHPSDLLQSQTALGVTLSIQHNDSPRTVILKATSSKDANVMGSFSAQIVLPG
ncbi:hypothetical protein, partial [Cohnella lupini]|uniref:hypothetical protein n=1 Tax=Cohnella lupini TaxID=1294267 RepID=UPI001C6DD57F